MVLSFFRSLLVSFSPKPFVNTPRPVCEIEEGDLFFLHIEKVHRFSSSFAR